MPIRSVVATPPHIVRYEDGSEWHIRAVKNDGDDEAIQNLTTATITRQIKPKELRRARRENRVEELVMDNITQETRMSVKRATLFHMTDSWSGPEFTIPMDYVKGEEFKTPEKDPRTGTYVPHPLAGELAPLAPEWVGVRDPNELDEIIETMEEIWAGRSPEDEESFSGSGERVDESESGRSAAGEVPVPDAAE